MRTMTLVFFLFAIPPGVNAVQNPERKDNPMRVEFTKSNDQSVITGSKINDTTQTILEIRSERGIGECKVYRTGDKWPEEFILRLPLRGLEQIIFQVGDHRWIGGVSSTDGMVRWSSQSKNDCEHPIPSAEDPTWCTIRVARGVDNPRSTTSPPFRVPLSDGESWEMTVPPAWLKDNPESIRLSWIDFFR